MCFKIRSIRFFCCCDTTKNLEKPPKIQSKFEFMNEQVPKFSFKKLIHLSTQNLNLGLEFKTRQNHPVNRTKNNTVKNYPKMKVMTRAYDYVRFNKIFHMNAVIYKGTFCHNNL